MSTVSQQWKAAAALSRQNPPLKKYGFFWNFNEEFTHEWGLNRGIVVGIRDQGKNGFLYLHT